MITKKLLNVGRDGASYQYARTFCRFGPPEAGPACAKASAGRPGSTRSTSPSTRPFDKLRVPSGVEGLGALSLPAVSLSNPSKRLRASDPGYKFPSVAGKTAFCVFGSCGPINRGFRGSRGWPRHGIHPCHRRNPRRMVALCFVGAQLACAHARIFVISMSSRRIPSRHFLRRNAAHPSSGLGAPTPGQDMT
jgi:hypothetical protein